MYYVHIIYVYVYNIIYRFYIYVMSTSIYMFVLTCYRCAYSIHYFGVACLLIESKFFFFSLFSYSFFSHTTHIRIYIHRQALLFHIVHVNDINIYTYTPNVRSSAVHDQNGNLCAEARKKRNTTKIYRHIIIIY